MSLRCCLIWLFFGTIPVSAAAPLGYYRYPTIHKDTIVFVAEGDLWKVSAEGGTAIRLTTHASEEGYPTISPDGKTIAFAASYEGSTEIYTMPIDGGQPTRRTWGIGRITHVGWVHNDKLLISTNLYSTKPDQQLVLLDLSKKDAVVHERIPLAQAADGCYDATGKTLFFTRLPFQGSHTKRYKGGTAQNLWSFTSGEPEAKSLTASYPGTSKEPMWWEGRVYFLTDRDGTMNVWSMKPAGTDLKQHTKSSGWDVMKAALSDGLIVYQRGADLHRYAINKDEDKKLEIRLPSDFDQMREKWVKNPAEFISSAHISADGSKVAITARGRVFVAPAKEGRIAETGKSNGVRHREARILPNGQILVLSDESEEVELWTLPANGIGEREQLTKDGEVLRWEAVASPNGKFIAHRDKNQRLFLYDVDKKENKKIAESNIDELDDLAWSPDSHWLAYTERGDNMFRRIKLHHVADNKSNFVTTDRYDSFSPTWSVDGKWLYFLSNRNLVSLVPSPWGTYQPEPFLDKKTKLYMLPLTEEDRSPFLPSDELQEKKKKEPKKEEPKKEEPKKEAKQDEARKEEKKEDGLQIDFADIAARIQEVPVPAGNYQGLSANDKALFWINRPLGGNNTLQALAISNDNPEVKTVLADVRGYELSQDGKKMLLQRGNSLFVVDAIAAPADLNKKEVPLGNWSMSITPREEWRQMFVEAWRLERDYFYDRGMHGTDWKAIRKKYEPLVDRVSNRAELSDLIAQMVSELSALHIFVNGGDFRRGEDNIFPASLGAVLVRDDAAGGYRVDHIYKHDPDEPDLCSPLAKPEVRVKEGDIIETIDGKSTLSVTDIHELLRRKAGQQVLLKVKSPKADKTREVIVKPISAGTASNLRYHEWEHTRRLKVEDLGKGEIGYVHLRAMGGNNFTEWAKNFYPVFARKGLIIDVRANRGGNIDSWIIGRLLRKAWFFWTQRVGRQPLWNMQYAFRGHIVVLCDEFTASDGEAFSEGIKRLGLGTVIGTRTWGGEIWLTSSNSLVDRGIATSAEFGVFGPEGAWLIEGHGVDPDIVVDNLPHATYKGEDAQLLAGIKHLQKMIKEKPVELPPIPKYPRP